MKKQSRFFLLTTFSLTFLVLGLTACGIGTGTGTVQVLAVPEETIPEGIQPGTGAENIVDGWTISYSKFIVVIGNFRASRSADPSAKLSHPDVLVVDLKQVPAGGLVLASLKDVAAVRWDKVGYNLENATSSAKKAEGVSQADYDEMVKNGWSLRIVGQLTKSDGQSCKPGVPTDCVTAKTISFDWGVKGGTSFDDCAPPQGDAGFSVPTGGTIQVKPTIHGDHWFFTNITQGAEITKRRAQWIANCDLDRDGKVTIDELKQVKAADVFPAADYNLSGALIPINTAYDYLEAQVRTLGDYEGEGECPTRKPL